MAQVRHEHWTMIILSKNRHHQLYLTLRQNISIWLSAGLRAVSSYIVVLRTSASLATPPNESVA